MEQVTWPQAARFCNARSRLEGLKPCYNEDTGECDFEANGYRLPDRGRMGIRLPGRHGYRLLLRQRRAQARRLRLVGRQFRQEDSSGRPEEAQCLGSVRHARQRRRVVPGCLRQGLLPDQPRQESAWPGGRQGIRPSRRLLEIGRGGPAVRLPARRDAGFLRCLSGSRCHRLPLRARGTRSGMGLRFETTATLCFSTPGYSSSFF